MQHKILADLSTGFPSISYETRAPGYKGTSTHPTRTSGQPTFNSKHPSLPMKSTPALGSKTGVPAGLKTAALALKATESSGNWGAVAPGPPLQVFCAILQELASRYSSKTC